MKKLEYVSLLLLSIMILFNVNYLLIFIIGLIIYIRVYYIEAINNQRIFGLFRVTLLTLPFSYINIFGDNYGNLPLSWYNILLLFLSVAFLLDFILNKNKLNKKTDMNALSNITFILIIIIIIIFLNSNNYFESLNDLLNNIAPLVFLLLGLHFRKIISEKQTNILIKDYIAGTLIASSGIFIQYLFIKTDTLVIGNYQFLGGYRDAFGYLFLDYSFLSLYIVTGALLLLLISDKKLRYILIFFMLLMSILTSARTGIVSFIIVFSIYNLVNIYKIILKDKIKGLMLLSINLLSVMAVFIGIVIVRGGSSTSDSGRTKLNEIAFNIFKSNPISGVGFGSKTYNEIGGMLPHNIIFQALAQGGLIYFISLSVFIIMLLYFSYKNNKPLFYVISTIFIGSLFIPNIMSSRFIGIVFLILGLTIPLTKKESMEDI